MRKSGIASGNSRYWMVAAVFVVLKLTIHFLTNTRYELHRDELLYFNMADHPAFGYASVPPLTGWLAWLTQMLFGYSVFGIRFFPALLGAASLFIIARTVKDLGGGLLALATAASAFLLSTGFLLFDTLFTPNVIEQFLWLLITWCIFRMTLTRNPQWWLGIGFLLGLAFLNKYSIAIFIAGFATAFFISPYRSLFRSRYFVYAIFLTALFFCPISSGSSNTASLSFTTCRH